MTIGHDWQPDPRQVYEPELCRLQTVYRILTAHRYYDCAECHGRINVGEKHDAVAVAGAGIGGYTNPGRIHCDCREGFIKRQNERYAELHRTLLSICAWCGLYLGYKDGQGQTGLSHGLCGECEKVWMEEVK